MDVRTCKEFAAECMRLAGLARSVEHRAVLMHMVDSWNQMAQELEKEAEPPRMKMGSRN